jgi:hypothetical protein
MGWEGSRRKQLLPHRSGLVEANGGSATSLLRRLDVPNGEGGVSTAHLERVTLAGEVAAGVGKDLGRDGGLRAVALTTVGETASDGAGSLAGRKASLNRRVGVGEAQGEGADVVDEIGVA